MATSDAMLLYPALALSARDAGLGCFPRRQMTLTTVSLSKMYAVVNQETGKREMSSSTLLRLLKFITESCLFFLSLQDHGIGREVIANEMRNNNNPAFGADSGLQRMQCTTKTPPTTSEPF